MLNPSRLFFGFVLAALFFGCTFASTEDQMSEVKQTAGHRCYPLSSYAMSAVNSNGRFSLSGSMAATHHSFRNQREATGAAASLQLHQVSSYCVFGSYDAPSAAYFVAKEATRSNTETCFDTTGMNSSSDAFYLRGTRVFPFGNASVAQGVQNIFRNMQVGTVCVSGAPGANGSVYIFIPSSATYTNGGGERLDDPVGPSLTPFPTTDMRIDVYAERFYVAPGESTVIHWSATQAMNCRINGGAFGAASGWLQTGALYENVYYQIDCISFNGVMMTTYTTVRVEDRRCPYGKELFEGACIPICQNGLRRDRSGMCVQP